MCGQALQRGFYLLEVGEPRSTLALANAELFLIPGFFDEAGDFQRVRESLAHVSAPDPLGTLKSMFEVADEILARNWVSIRLLSRHLFERGRLETEELEQWFERHPARCHYHPVRSSV